MPAVCASFAERGKGGRGFDQFFAGLEKRHGGHAENFAGAAAEHDLLALDFVQRGDFVDERVVFRARVAVAAGGGFAQDGENFLGRAVGIFVAIEKDGVSRGSAARLWRRRRVSPQCRFSRWSDREAA